MEDAAQALGEHSYWQSIELKTRPTGEFLLAGTPEQSRRSVLAAVAQTQHWDRQADALRASAQTDLERANVHHQPDFPPIWLRRRQAEAVVRTLLKRNLPFDKDDLRVLLSGVASATGCPPTTARSEGSSGPCSGMSRVTDSIPICANPYNALRVGCGLPSSRNYIASGQIWNCCVGRWNRFRTGIGPSRLATPPSPRRADRRTRCWPLKREVGMLPAEPLPATTVIGPDRFPLPDISPLSIEHGLLTALFEDVVGKPGYHEPQLDELRTGRKLIGGTLEETGQVVIAAAERHFNTSLLPDNTESDTERGRGTLAVP